jgi:hypothetical protein
MPMPRILGTAALLTTGGQLPVLAQAAIQEPGAYAFYHPGGDVLNAGRPKPRYAPLNQMQRTDQPPVQWRGPSLCDYAWG